MKVFHEKIVLTAADGWPIHISYFQSDQGKETPVVVLLHAEGSNRQLWGNDRMGFGKRLWEQGYAVITVDLRKHGQSIVPDAGPQAISPADRKAMVAFDMEAVKEFIFTEHMAERLNMNKTGIIAPEMSAAVAIHYAIRDWAKQPYDDGINTPRGQDIRTLILLSPERDPEGLATGSALTTLGKMASNQIPAMKFSMLFLYGAEDGKDRDTRQMHKLSSRVRGGKDQVLINSYPYKFRGIELIGPNNPRTKCEEHMLGFLGDHLKKLTQTPWQDRRSRFAR